MFQNDIQSLGGRHTSLPLTAQQNLPSTLLPSEMMDFIPDPRSAPLRKISAEATAAQEKQLSLPSRHSLAADENFTPPTILYRNSAECRPYHHALHAFEGSQFGNDFTCQSADFEHWFDAEAYFCAASFSNADSKHAQVLSLIAMLFVTEASAIDLLNGKIAEQELVPHSEEAGSPPVVYYSAMISNNAMSAILLYKSILRDISAYKSKINTVPAWGFSIALTEKAVQHLSNSGFYPIKANFLNKYHILKIDSRSAQSKIWTSIFSQPETNRITKTPANNIATHLRYRDKSIGNAGVIAAGKYDPSRTSPALYALPEPVR